MLPQVRSQAVRLGVSLVKAGATRDGPLHLLSDGEDTRKLGFPIRGSAQPRGRYAIHNAREFRYVATTLDTGGEVPAQVARLTADIERAGLAMTGESRLVLPAGDGSEVELQLGVE